MSGPYCGTCVHFMEGFRGSPGECHDPAKRVSFGKAGDYSNARPEVMADVHTCRNHRPENWEQVDTPEGDKVIVDFIEENLDHLDFRFLTNKFVAIRLQGMTFRQMINSLINNP